LEVHTCLIASIAPVMSTGGVTVIVSGTW
jgi:hypothetical protein